MRFILLFALAVFAENNYLQDLEENGYCVIPNVLSPVETDVLYERVWHEYIEKAWPKCKMDDRSHWKESFPILNLIAHFAGPIGQTQVMWDLRQDPRIVDIFAKIWNTNNLIVSMDGMSIMCPTSIREEDLPPWPCAYQGLNKRKDGVQHNNHPPEAFVSESSLNTKPFTIEGQFLFEDSGDGDGGFYCIPKSHLKFEEFSPTMDELEVSEAPWSEKGVVRDRLLAELFPDGTSYVMKHVTAPKGSLILWDSRTLHYGIGGEYKPHYDYFDPSTPGGLYHYNRGGQRVASFIVYLNTPEAGGETVFPKAKLRVKPEKGKALLFYNVDPEGKEDPMSFHGGAPVIAGEKWIITRWLRQGEFF